MKYEKAALRGGFFVFPVDRSVQKRFKTQIEVIQTGIFMKNLVFGVVLLLGATTAASAGTYKSIIDKDYVANGFGEPVKVEGKDRFPLVTYTKVFEQEGKLTICGAQFGLVDKRFTGKASIKVGEKRLMSNINFFYKVMNAKKFTEARKNATTKEAILKTFSATENLDAVIGLTSSCRQTRQKWKPEYGIERPKVVIPSKIVVYTRS